MDFINSINIPTLKKSHAKLIIFITVGLSILALIIFLVSRSILGSDSIVSRNSDYNSGSSENIEAYIIEGGPRINISSSISKTIKQGEPLSANDVLNTDENSRAVIIYPNNSYILLDNNSRLTLTEEGYNLDGRVFVRNNDELDINLNLSSLDIVFNLSRGSASVFDDQVEVINRLGDTTLRNENTELILDEESIFESTTDEITNTEDFGEFISSYNPDDENISFWEEFIICFDSKVSEALSDGRAERNNALSARVSNLLGCNEEITQERFDKLEEENRQAILDEINSDDGNTEEEEEEPPEIISVQDNGAYLADADLACTWNISGDTQYSEYSIGTSAGNTDILDWTETQETTFLETLDSPEANQEYYCNIRATNEAGTSSSKSSDGIIYDPSTGTVSIDSYPPGKVDGVFSFSDLANPSDVVISVYVKNGDMYHDGNEYVDTIIWHATTYNQSSNELKWKSTTDFAGEVADFEGGIVFVQVKNNQTGKIITQITSEIP